MVISSYQVCVLVSYVLVAHACRWKCKYPESKPLCQFPDWLQNDGDGDAWLFRPTSELSVLATIDGGTIFATECRVGNNRRVEDCEEESVSNCRKRHTDDKYLVQMTDLTDEMPMFRCIQFIKRSDTVVEVKSSDFQKKEDDALCSNQLTFIQGSPLIRTNNGLITNKMTPPCLIHGAFSYNAREHGSNCTLRGHLKSDCMPKRGIAFLFEKNECQNKSLLLEFSCLATWKDENSGNLYSVVSRNDNDSEDSEIWCLFIEQGDFDESGIMMTKSGCRHYSDGYQSQDLHFRIAIDNNETCHAFPEMVNNKSATAASNQLLYMMLACLVFCNMLLHVSII